MDFLYAIFIFIATAVLLLLTAFSFLILRIFTGKSIKNPKFPPVKGTVFDQLFYINTLYDYQTKVAKKQPTFRLLSVAESVVYTADVRNVEHVLTTSFSKYSKGKYSQEVVKDLFGEGIFVVEGEKWKQQRKLASLEFSTRVLREFSCGAFRRNAAKLGRVISELSSTDQVFDVQDLLMRCTLDSIFKIGFGVDLKCLEGSSKEGTAFIKAFDDFNDLVYWRFSDPFWKLKKGLNIGSEASIKNNIKLIDNMVYEIIRTKRKQLAQKQDYNDKEDTLSRFLVESEKDPEKMNDQYLRDIILNFMIAGKDTTSGTLSWFLYMLCKHPLVQERIVQEITEVINMGDNEAGFEDFVANITDSTMEKMQYLHAALTETLRLYPAIPVDGRCAEADDTLPDGYKLKKGDGVYYMAYAMGRMPYIWGEDAEDFRPERWLNNGNFQPKSPFKFVAFHAGPRICLGKDFAYRQMKITAMALLRFFRFKLDDDTKKVTYKTMFILNIDGGLHLRAAPRIVPSNSDI